MRKIKFSTSIPANLSEFSSEPNEKFSRAKLKVFYIGETEDHRLFTEKFSKELIKTLPYTPVVSQYVEEDDDFKGHASEQAIYGIVDPKSKISFEEDENGKTWAVCDVVLYTERRDMVGTIAKKIPGNAQSLEMDPKTIQYTVNYDSKMKIKNIEFTKGELIGVSVLGKNQKPAFTGSAFFEASDFQEKMQLLINYCQNNEERGTEMDATILNFVELSWGEKSQRIVEALEQRYGKYCVYPVDWFDNSVVCYIYYEALDKCILTRVYFNVSEDAVIELGDAEEVRVIYEKVEAPVNDATVIEDAPAMEEIPTTNAEEVPITTAETDVMEEDGSKDDDEDAPCGCEETDVVDAADDDKDDDKDDPCGCEENHSENSPENEECGDNKEDKEEQCSIIVEVETGGDAELQSAPEAENSVDVPIFNNEEGAANADENQSNVAALTESERQEFEALKRAKKLNLLESYNDLPAEILDEFKGKVDEMNFEDLEAALAIEFRRIQQTQPKSSSMRTFSIIPRSTGIQSEKAILADLVNKYKNKN